MPVSPNFLSVVAAFSSYGEGCVWVLDSHPLELFSILRHSGSAETGTKTEQTSVEMCVSGTIWP